MAELTVIAPKLPDGFVAYPPGLISLIVGKGETCEEAMADVQSAIRFHIDTFGDNQIQVAGARLT